MAGERESRVHLKFVTDYARGVKMEGKNSEMAERVRRVP